MQPVLQRIQPAELVPMPFNLRLMNLIGILGPRRNFFRFVLAFGWGVFMILFPKVVLGMGSSELNAIIKGLSELLFHGNLYISTLIVVLNINSFERMVQLFNEIITEVTAKDQPRDCYEMIREQNSKINKFVKLYFIYCCFGTFVFCIPPIATSYWRYFSTGNGSESVQLELPMEQEFYGLQIRTNFAHYHIYMICSLPAYFICAYLSVLNVTTLLIMIKYSSLMYRLVTLRILTLTQDSNISKSSKRNALIEIVQIHSKALEITELVEKIVNIPLAMQFLSCIMFWCLVMIYLSINIDFNLINVMVAFWLSLIETYGFSYLGSELTESAKAVGEAIYELRWYNDSVQLQHYYRLILQRAQRKTGVTAAKFFIVGIEKFGKVVHMTYSYFVVLKKSLDE